MAEGKGRSKLSAWKHGAQSAEALRQLSETCELLRAIGASGIVSAS